MAASRKYVRGSNGRFAGASSGTVVTTGRSGGFSNAAFRARVAQSRTQPSTSKKRTSPFMRAVRNKKVQKAAVHLALGAGVAAYNKKKYGINPMDGVAQAVRSVSPNRRSAARPYSARISTKA